MGENPHGSHRPLGELLVSRGVITAAQLQHALEAQRESGRPLGETVVRLGYTTGPRIAQALATQSGRLLKTEYGFATPAGPSAAAPARQLPEARVEDLARQLARAATTLAEGEVTRARLEDDNRSLRARIAALEAALRQARRPVRSWVSEG